MTTSTNLSKAGTLGIGWLTAMLIMVGGDFYLTRQWPSLSDLFLQALIAIILGYPLGWLVASKAGLR